MSRVISSDFFENPSWELLDEPMLRFTSTGSENIQFPIEGIQKFGPYDYNTRGRSFDSVRVVYLYRQGPNRERKMKKINSRIMEKIKYYRGFSKEFKLDSVNSEFIGLKDEINEWKAALHELEPYSINPSSTERTIVMIAGGDYKAFSDTEHYYSSKRILLDQGVPCQYLSSYSGSSGTGVLKQNLDGPNFEYTVWNVALSAYAKIGGIPWILKDKVVKHHSIDAIAGIRFARDKSNDDNQKYIIGAITVFGSYGLLYGVDAQRFMDVTEEGERYIARSRGLFVGEEDAEKLAKIIVERYRDKENQSPNHIIIHKLGSFHPEELRGLEKGLRDSSVEKYAFIEIFRGGNPRVFDITEGNAESVRRGLVLGMSDSSSLICTTGNQEYEFRGYTKKPEHTMGTPVPISANIRLTNNSIENPILAAQNIFNLTSLHWGCGWSQEIQLPVTLEFAHKIATLYAHGVMPHDNLRNTSWFL